MVRISGVDLPRAKRVEIGLTYIFGIGLTSSKKIISTIGISPDTRCMNLTNEEINALRILIAKTYQTEGDLKRVYALNVKRLVGIRCARGSRHLAGLPVRGQRTRTNARTSKKKSSALKKN